MRLLLIAFLVLTAPALAWGQAQSNASVIDAAIHSILEGEDEPTAAALKTLRALGDRGAVAPLIQMLFWTDTAPPIVETLEALTGARPGGRFFDWMVWQEDHPQPSYEGYTALLVELLTGLDRNYDRFLRPGIAHTIRLEELAWGGVKVNAIPPLDAPRMVAAAEAAYLNADDRVFGVSLNGDSRAYPLRIMNWHEMANDVVGGIPVSLAYCTLCGAGILYDGRVEGAPAAVTFATSGLLYRSNKLMFDRISESLWNQFTGRPVIGQLAGLPLRLKQLPMVIESWEHWRATHPDTRVLAQETGYSRDYAPGTAYRAYFASPDLAFPAAVHDRSLKPKEKVFGIEVPGGRKSWPLASIELIQERVGLLDVVLIGTPGTDTVRAYEATGHRFVRTGADRLGSEDGDWTVTEAALVGPGGRSLPRLPGHVAYWFAWSGFLGD